MAPLLFNVKMGMGRMGVRFQGEGREWRFPCLLYADYLVLCGESEEDLSAMVVRFFKVCRRRGLIVNAVKSKVMVLGGEEGLEGEVCVDGIRVEHVSEFKYFSRKVARRRRVAGAIRSLVNAKSLQLECAMVLHDSLLVPLLTYGNETMIWREKEI